MGELRQTAFGVGDADGFEKFQRAVFGLAVGQAELRDHAFGQLSFDVDNRVERRHGLLEDHGDASAAVSPHLGGLKLEEVGPPEPDFTINDSAWRRRNQPKDA